MTKVRLNLFCVHNVFKFFININLLQQLRKRNKIERRKSILYKRNKKTSQRNFLNITKRHNRNIF